MKSVSLALILAALLLSLLSLHQWGPNPWIFAPLAVAIGVAAASCMQGGVSWLSVVLGSLSPLAFRWAQPHSAWLALALLLLLWSAPRVWLARTRQSLAALAASMLALSLLAGWVATRFTQEGVLQSLAACIFAGAALSLGPLLVRTDSPIAHALETTARVIDDTPLRDALLRAAEVHRTHFRDRLRDSVPGTTWRTLLALSDRRASLRNTSDAASDAIRKELDAAILAKVHELTRDELPVAEAKSSSPPKPAAAPEATSPTTQAAVDAAQGTAPKTEIPATVIPAQDPLPVTAAVTSDEPALDGNLVVNATVP